MSANATHLFTPDNENERKEAADVSRQIAAIIGTGEGAELLLHDDDKKVKVPLKALHMLREILDMMAKGDAISIVPIHTELTTQQAADFLNVSRPYLVKLLDKGEGPTFHRVGRHRRIRFDDLRTYQEELEKQKTEAMDELVAQAQELNMGY